MSTYITNEYGQEFTYEETMRFLRNAENSRDCGNCPYSAGMEGNGQLPCGHFRCWVDCHCREV